MILVVVQLLVEMCNSQTEFPSWTDDTVKKWSTCLVWETIVGGELVLLEWKSKTCYKSKQRSKYKWNLPPLLSSDSMGCFRAVISLKVSRKSTTRSRSFFMGAIWSSSHSGVSAHKHTSSLRITHHWHMSVHAAQFRSSNGIIPYR